MSHTPNFEKLIRDCSIVNFFGSALPPSSKKRHGSLITLLTVLHLFRTLVGGHQGDSQEVACWSPFSFIHFRLALSLTRAVSSSPCLCVAVNVLSGHVRCRNVGIIVYISSSARIAGCHNAESTPNAARSLIYCVRATLAEERIVAQRPEQRAGRALAVVTRCDMLASRVWEEKTCRALCHAI